MKWLGHVAIAQWDEEEYQGWKRLGIPRGIMSFQLSAFPDYYLSDMKTEAGVPIDMGAVIRDGTIVAIFNFVDFFRSVEKWRSCACYMLFGSSRYTIKKDNSS